MQCFQCIQQNRRNLDGMVVDDSVDDILIQVKINKKLCENVCVAKLRALPTPLL